MKQNIESITFYTLPLYKVRGIMLYPPFINLHLSVRSSANRSVRLYVRWSALCFHSLLDAFLTIFFMLGIIVDFGKECLGIADGFISTNKYRVMALD